MKIKYLLIIALFFSCGAHKSTLHTKKIQTTTIKEDFSVITDNFSPVMNKTYYWYKSNELHQSKGDYSGEVLHGNYTKYYITNELAEKGEFNYGVKTKQWKSWFKNGQLKAVENYSNGNLSGAFTLYSDDGAILTSGKYSNNKKTGQWIDYVTKDTLNYKKGNIVKQKDSVGNVKQPFFKRLFKKKDTLNIEKNNKNIKVQERKRNNTSKRKPNKVKPPKKTKKPKKDSFLKRLFSKKDKNAKS